MTYTAITAKGQVVIPAAIRKRLNLKGGTRFCVVESGGRVIFQPLTKDYFERAAGVLNDKSDLVKMLLEERRKDGERENKK